MSFWLINSDTVVPFSERLECTRSLIEQCLMNAK